MKTKIAIISQEVFQASLIVYLVLLLLEQVKTDFVGFFFNSNILLAIVIISGILLTLTKEETKQNQTKGKRTRWEFFYILIISFVGAALVYYKTAALGQLLSTGIAMITMVLIVLLAMLMQEEVQ